MKARFWTSTEQALAVKWRRAGLKTAAIARRLDRPPHSVAMKLYRMGIIVEPHKRPRQKRGELLRLVSRALLRGESVTETATRFGVEHGYVSLVRKRLGIPPATPAERLKRSWVFRSARGDKPPNRWPSGKYRVNSRKGVQGFMTREEMAAA